MSIFGICFILYFLKLSACRGFKLHQVCENQTCCNLMFADLQKVVKITCMKLVNKKS